MVLYKQDKQSAGRLDEEAFKPDWVMVGFNSVGSHTHTHTDSH